VALSSSEHTQGAERTLHHAHKVRAPERIAARPGRPLRRRWPLYIVGVGLRQLVEPLRERFERPLGAKPPQELSRGPGRRSLRSRGAACCRPRRAGGVAAGGVVHKALQVLARDPGGGGDVGLRLLELHLPIQPASCRERLGCPHVRRRDAVLRGAAVILCDDHSVLRLAVPHRAEASRHSVLRVAGGGWRVAATRALAILPAWWGRVRGQVRASLKSQKCEISFRSNRSGLGALDPAPMVLYCIYI
jgi:hypothetical protein